ARLEPQPAKNPSFWTKSSVIEQVYTPVGEFWLPARNRSVGEIRLGGTAELTIQYNEYRLVNGDEVNKVLQCPIFCAVGRVSVAQLFLSSSSRRRGCGEVGSA